MRNKKLNHNRQIMLGVMSLAVVVFIVVVAFWVWCFPNGTAAPVAASGYTIRFSESFEGDSIQVHLNDSLLFDGVVAGADFSLPAEGCGEQDVLMVGDARLDVLYTFTLEQGHPVVNLTKEAGGVKMRQSDTKNAVRDEKKH
ncbi:MAG: hypothetical protein NC388_09815 [Clostridium sp.]|nr:hypothetical protein [Clostridium sp.]